MSVTPGGTPDAAGAAGTSPEGQVGASIVPAILVMHAELAQALIHAAEKVYGPIHDVLTISNNGLSRGALEEAINDAVAGWKQGGLVLTDFWGGSCHTCGMAAARGKGEVVILTGVNLPVLLDYLHNRDKGDAASLAERLQQKGRESIRTQRGTPA